jgi:biotin carboxylase
VSAAGSQGGSDALPRLAFVYDPESFPVFEIIGAAEGVCTMLWIIDTSIGASAQMAKLLRRLGSVVDVAGLSTDAAATQIAEFHPDGILTLKDSRMAWTAAVAEQLGLPFHSSEVARRLTDKHAQRLTMQAAGVPVPGFWPVPAPANAPAWDQLAVEARFPAVLKPRYDSEGSRDTIRVESIDAVREEAESGSGQALVLEEYLGDRIGGVRPCFADYVSVESVISDGVVSHVAVNGRFPPAEPFRESGFFIAAELSDTDRQAALDVATAALTGLGLTTGCPHTEIKFTPDGARVIEVNGRIGGGVPEMLTDISELRLLPVAFRIALGEHVEFARTVQADLVGFLFYVHAPTAMRRILRVEGLDALRADPAIADVTINRGPGAAVNWREGNHGHVFSVRGTVPDHDALERIDQRVHHEVRIVGE